MKLTFTTLCFFIFTATLVHAQPQIQWQKSFGGTREEYSNEVIATTDGGYMVAGNTYSMDGDVTFSFGPSDCWLVKLDNLGNKMWQKSLGGSYYDEAVSIKQTPDSGYIMLANSASNDGDVSGHHHSILLKNDYWLVKLNATGEILWQKSFGGTGEDFAQSVALTADGGYILAGWSNSTDGDVTGNHGDDDWWIVKVDSAGTLVWQKSLGGPGSDLALCVKQVNDSSYVVAGSNGGDGGDVSGNHGMTDWWIVMLNRDGDIVSQNSYGGSRDELAYSIQNTNDTGFIIAGRSASFDGDVASNKGNEDYWIVKLNKSYGIEWKRSYGGNANDNANSVRQTSDNGYIVAGYTESTNGDVTGNHSSVFGADQWIIKLSETGDFQWQEFLGGTGSEYARSILETADKGYIITGHSYSTDGDVTGNHGNYDYWVVKLGQDFVLPVRMTGFTAKRVNNGVMCTWQTSAEQNTKYFLVQRSSDGRSFTTAGKVLATGNAHSFTNYSFTDANSSALQANKLYYRLQEVDNNGNSTYSGIQVVDLQKAGALFTVSPNPATDYIYIASSQTVADARITITEMGGKVLFTGKQSFIAEQKVRIPVTGYPGSVLLVTIAGNGYKELYKIVMK